MLVFIIISLQLTKEMFFHRSTRVKTEPRIDDTVQNTFYDYRRRAKVKNIRLSLGQQFDKADQLESKNQFNEKREVGYEREQLLQHKKPLFLKKLPQLNFQNRQSEKQTKQVTKQLKQLVVKSKKKQLVSNSILDILKPNPNWYSNGGVTRKFATRILTDWKLEFQTKQYKNEFNEQISHYSSTKHYRTPKIIENDLMKFKNSSNIVRRKIVSEDKYREKQQKVYNESKDQSDPNKANSDLQKIEIITFSNKFPLFKKQSSYGK